MDSPASQEHFQNLFEYAPISLWEEDFSGLKRLFDELRRQGVRSLEQYLREHPEFGDTCIRQMTVLKVNRQTLALFKAASQAELIASLGRVFRDGMRHHFRSELLALWQGELSWSGEGVNYTLEGQAVEILLHLRVLPGFESSWERVLVTIENITARKNAERRLRSLFEASPISLWEEDSSAVGTYFESLRADGVTDLEAYLQEHPEAAIQSASLIKVLDVNQKTVEMFAAGSKQELLANLDRVFRDEMSQHFTDELVDLWNGRLAYERDGINYSLNGEAVDIHLNLRVLAGHEQDFGRVLVAIQDITARKRAEDYMRYLGTHDMMTGLYNRHFFEETLRRLEKERQDPLSILIADLDGLKQVNDASGHPVGDELIRRGAEVLQKSFSAECTLARIGGDEFAVFMPSTDEQGAQAALTTIHEMVLINNKVYREPELSISLGVATSQVGLSLEKVIRLADDAMYRDKGKHHRRRKND